VDPDSAMLSKLTGSGKQYLSDRRMSTFIVHCPAEGIVNLYAKSWGCSYHFGYFITIHYI